MSSSVDENDLALCGENHYPSSLPTQSYNNPVKLTTEVAKNKTSITPMFKFRLDPLITIRDNKLKERQRKLAEACEARRILEGHLQEIDRQIEEGIDTARSLIQPGQTVNVESLIGFRRQEMFLRANQDDLMQKIKMVDKEIDNRRIAVVEANKELKVIEKLKEKRHEKYLVEEGKAEMKAMDEIAGNRR